MAKKKKNKYDIEVLYEDNHLIAVNKPAGWLVQGDETGDKPLSEFVKDYIKKKYDKPGDVFLGVIHRLDRPVSGVCIFARTSKGLERMNKLFREREAQKTYLAIVNERPNPYQGELVDYLIKDRERNRAKALDRPSRRNKDAKKAELSYELLGEVGRNYLVKVNPKTGRPHQIRVQLAKFGYPIMDDRKYGAPNRKTDGSIFLHSYQLKFMHPIKKERVSITADPPDKQIWKLFEDVL
ncbi:MAG: RluA family pseudouridine synthase [Saprospiraceae bacterium]